MWENEELEICYGVAMKSPMFCFCKEPQCGQAQEKASDFLTLLCSWWEYFRPQKLPSHPLPAWTIELLSEPSLDP